MEILTKFEKRLQISKIIEQIVVIIRGTATNGHKSTKFVSGSPTILINCRFISEKKLCTSCQRFSNMELGNLRELLLKFVQTYRRFHEFPIGVDIKCFKRLYKISRATEKFKNQQKFLFRSGLSMQGKKGP